MSVSDGKGNVKRKGEVKGQRRSEVTKESGAFERAGRAAVPSIPAAEASPVDVVEDPNAAAAARHR